MDIDYFIPKIANIKIKKTSFRVEESRILLMSTVNGKQSHRAFGLLLFFSFV